VAESARRRNATPDVTVRAPLQEYCRTVDGQRVSLRIVVCATLALRNLMCGWQTVQLEEADIKMGSSRERERESKKGRSVAESARRRNATPDVTVTAPLQEYCRTVDGRRVSQRTFVCAAVMSQTHVRMTDGPVSICKKRT
jgi:hypothetical protein